jgi:medium-chain acyl-[acyl-carrier-protein] hydrolase
MYRTWRGLSALIEVVPVALPGREGRSREPLLGSLDAIVGDALRGMRARLAQPYALFGHSMGALVAFEVARLLRQEGARPPAALFVAGRVAPHLTDRYAPMHELPRDVFEQRIRELGGTPSTVFEQPELLDSVLPVLREDFRASETRQYVSQVPLGCPIVAFGGAHDPTTPVSDLLAWREQTASDFSHYVFPRSPTCSGNHFFIQEVREQLLRIMENSLLRFAAARAATTRENMRRHG